MEANSKPDILIVGHGKVDLLPGNVTFIRIEASERIWSHRHGRNGWRFVSQSGSGIIRTTRRQEHKTRAMLNELLNRPDTVPRPFGLVIQRAAPKFP
jgi:hypothetical protein